MGNLITNKMIEDDNGQVHYFDNLGDELFEFDMVSIAGGEPKTLYRTDDGQLGTDATNPEWIARGLASECEYGIYCLNREDMKDILKVN